MARLPSAVAATLALALASGFALTGCSVNPATGERQFSALLPIEDEAEYGRELSAELVRRMGGRLDDPRAAAMVERVVARLAAVTRAVRPDLTWTPVVVDDAAFNAFALPGGYIHVNRGALAMVNDEAELAALLAHEMAHVTARHAAAGIGADLLIDLVTAVAVVLARGDDEAVRRAAIARRLASAAYRRDQEDEADRLGMRYLSDAGYDPSAMARLVTGLMLDRDYHLSVEGGDAAFSFFDDHPPDEWRLAAAKDAAAGLPTDGDVGRDGYLDAIDGLAWGEVAARGLLQGRHVVHEELGFQFAFPTGYRAAVTLDRIIAENPNSGAVILFDVAANEDGGDVAAHLRAAWGEALGLEDIQSHRFGPVSPPAAKARGRLRLMGREWRAWAWAVGLSHDRTYRFLCLGPIDVDGGVEAACRDAAAGLRPINKGQARRRVVWSVRVETVMGDERVEDFAARMAFLPEPAALFRALNGMSEDEALNPGRRVKIITND